MPETKAKKGGEKTMVDNDFDPIAAALKKLHNDIAEEALPETFLRILDDIDAKIAARKSMR
jgi:hypothetical protein